MAPLLRFEAVERGFALGVVERHSPQAGSFSERLVESDPARFAPIRVSRRDVPDTPSGVPVANAPSLSVSTKALAGLIVCLGIVILGVAAFRLRKFLKSRSAKTLTNSSSFLKPINLCRSPLPEKIVSEKRNPKNTQTLIDFGRDSLLPPTKARTQSEKSDLALSDEAQYVGWAPQSYSWPQDNENASSPDLSPRPFVLPPQPPRRAALKVSRASRFSRLAAVFTRSPKPTEMSFVVDPSPPYTSTALPPQVASPNSSSLNTTKKCSPPMGAKSACVSSAKKAKRKTPPNLPPIMVTAASSKVVSIPAAPPVQKLPGSEMSQEISADEHFMKSPTRLDSANIALSLSQQADHKSKQEPSQSRLSKTSQDESRTGAPGKKLSRLVTVVKVFTPNLEDELRVHLGEVLRLTHEFHDGWCAVRRVGKDEERGVVPLSCVRDRGSIVHSDSIRYNSVLMSFTGSTLHLPEEKRVSS